MRTRTITTVLAWLGAAFMLFLGVRGFSSAVEAAKGFGFPLADVRDAFYIHVKADRDLGIGVALVALLLMRQRKAVMVLFAASILMPLIDCILLIASGQSTPLYALSVHGSAVVFIAVLVGLLARESEG